MPTTACDVCIEEGRPGAPLRGRCARCGGPACADCDRCHGCRLVICAACDTVGTAAPFAFPGDRVAHPHNLDPYPEATPCA